MKKITFTLLLLSNVFLFSQSSFNSESYRVSLGDIETNTFEKDSTARALVIYEQGNSYVDQGDYNLKTEFYHKIKILKREGFDKANVTILLYKTDNNRYEKVDDIIASTYNLVNGEVITSKLDKNNIYREKYDDNYTLVKFTLPNIKEGSVIMYSYKLSSPFMFKYKGWNFQDDIPKLYSDYKTSIPANWHYNVKLVGYKPLDINTSGVKRNCLEGGRGSSSDCSIYHYAMKDIPAFIEEEYMTHKSNYLARIEYELKTFQGFDGTVSDYTKTWKTVDKELKSEPSIGRQLSKSINEEDFLSSEIINEPNTQKRAEAIFKHVQENYTWNEEYDIFKDNAVKDLTKDKSSNVATINILLHNLLEACKIDVKPVLLSTRNNGFPTKIFPVISDFNYLIVQATIEGKTYLLDATDNYLSFGELPIRCLNSYGRLLDFKNGSEWIDIKPENLSTIQYNIHLKMDAENEEIAGSVEAKKTGYHALSARKSYYSNTESYVKDLQDKFPNGEISNHEVTSKNRTSFDFHETYQMAYNFEEAGGNIYLNPFYIKFFKDNPFKLQERTYPIDFGYEDTYLYMFNIDFGENYTVLEKPKDAILALPNKKGQIIFSTKLIKNSISILLKVEFKEAIYDPGYYPYLKEFMSKIIDIQNNSLILLKKK